MANEKLIITKEDELNALAKIRKIVEGLGENSYVGTAFDGVWGIATQNIDNDFANSVTFYLDAYYDFQDFKHEHEQIVKDLKASNKGLLTDLNIVNERYADLFDVVNANGLTICNLNNEIDTLKMKCEGYEEDVSHLESILASKREIRTNCYLNMHMELEGLKYNLRNRDNEILNLKAKMYDLVTENQSK